jgi:hypothetical protein
MKAGSGVEVPAGVAERVLPKPQCLQWGQLVYQGYPMAAEDAVVSNLEGPVTAVLRPERIGHLLQQRQGPHDNRLAVQNNVEALVPGVASGRHRALPVDCQVSRLLLIRAAAEIKRAVHPDRDNRSDVRTAIGPDGRHPIQPGLVQEGQRIEQGVAWVFSSL